MQSDASTWRVRLRLTPKAPRERTGCAVYFVRGALTFIIAGFALLAWVFTQASGVGGRWSGPLCVGVALCLLGLVWTLPWRRRGRDSGSIAVLTLADQGVVLPLGVGLSWSELAGIEIEGATGTEPPLLRFDVHDAVAVRRRLPAGAPAHVLVDAAPGRWGFARARLSGVPDNEARGAIKQLRDLAEKNGVRFLGEYPETQHGRE